MNYVTKNYTLRLHQGRAFLKRNENDYGIGITGFEYTAVVNIVKNFERTDYFDLSLQQFYDMLTNTLPEPPKNGELVASYTITHQE